MITFHDGVADLHKLTEGNRCNKLKRKKKENRVPEPLFSDDVNAHYVSPNERQ